MARAKGGAVDEAIQIGAAQRCGRSVLAIAVVAQAHGHVRSSFGPARNLGRDEADGREQCVVAAMGVELRKQPVGRLEVLALI